MNISDLSDDELLLRTEALASQERISNAALIEHLAEIDRRDLSVSREYGSLYDYCVNRLEMSEGGAYRRIRAARTFRAFPPVMTMLRDGRLTVESLVMLHPFRHAQDIASLAVKAAGLRSRQLEALLAERGEPGPSKDVVRFVGRARLERPADSPAPSLLEESATPTMPTNAIFAAISPPANSPPSQARRSIRPSVRIAFTADEEFYKLMQRARALLRHKYPDGRLEGVLKDALAALLSKKDRGFGWARRRSRG